MTKPKRSGGNFRPVTGVVALAPQDTARRVAVLGLGGTIQMDTVTNEEGQTYNCPPKDTDRFRSVLEAKLGEIPGMTYDFVLMSTADSIDKGPEDWKLIAEQVWEAQRVGYDAVIILHGTDTLAYTAQSLWLSFFDRKSDLSGLQIPVIVTGSQNPVYVPGGDGVLNLQNAARTALLASQLGIADVLVVFWEQVLRGIWSQKVTEKGFQAIQSPGRPLAGSIDGQGVHLNPAIAHKRENSLLLTSLPSASFDTSYSLSVNALPGTNPKMLERLLLGKYAPKLVMLDVEGEGNIAENLIPLIAKMTEQGSGSIIASRYSGADIRGASYLAGVAATKAGAGHSGKLNYIGVWVLMAWLIAWHPKAQRLELLDYFEKYARIL